ncbi:hypothetical protein [Streptomyces sp. SID12488]|uniref:hypothetical protein n=1 Tax=Streptomyces sp. SID12488 TaxID=2706040 RepID=UPI0031B9B986
MEESGAEDAGREAEGVKGPEGVEEPEAELPGSGAPGVEEDAELTAPDGVTPLSPVSAPPPSG